MQGVWICCKPESNVINMSRLLQ